MAFGGRIGLGTNGIASLQIVSTLYNVILVNFNW